MTEDRNFDDLFDRFRRNIKQTEKGWLREVLIRDDLLSVLPRLAAEPLDVLDAGCGLGDMSLWLAEQGHRVRSSDLSAKMIEHGRVEAKKRSLIIDFVHEPIQASLSHGTLYQLICCHAVMEWLDQPYAILADFSRSLTPGGVLSLTVYNHHRSVFNSLVKGNLEKIKHGDYGSTNPQSLSPPHPILPEKVRAGLEEQGLVIEIQAGIRCFYDYLSPKNKEDVSNADVLMLERRIRHDYPYRDFARYVHFVARRPA